MKQLIGCNFILVAENGSGGYMSDLTFNGGAFGIYGGSQQFTATRLRFNNVRTSVQLVWDWGWVGPLYRSKWNVGFCMVYILIHFIDLAGYTHHGLQDWFQSPFRGWSASHWLNHDC